MALPGIPYGNVISLAMIVGSTITRGSTKSLLFWGGVALAAYNIVR